MGVTYNVLLIVPPAYNIHTPCSPPPAQTSHTFCANIALATSPTSTCTAFLKYARIQVALESVLRSSSDTCTMQVFVVPNIGEHWEENVLWLLWLCLCATTIPLGKPSQRVGSIRELLPSTFPASSKRVPSKMNQYGSVNSPISGEATISHRSSS